MVDISLAFKALVDEFVNSAETEEQLQIFFMIGIAAWNFSNQTDQQQADAIQVFLDRFNCPTFIWNSTIIQTKDKILELCSRKLRLCPELKQRILSVDMEGMNSGFKYTVVTQDNPHSNQVRKS